MRSAQKSISRWEIIGAWLHVWTPPKGMDVPPVPTRKLLLGALGLAVIAAIAAALIIPPLNRGKRAGAERLARQTAAQVAAETARLRADQRPHSLRVGAGQALVPALEAAVTADAKVRASRHTIDGPVLRTNCAATPPYIAIYPHSRVYKCFVTTETGLQGEGGDKLGTGYPFVATVYPATRRVVWCKQNPHADEKGARGMVHVKVSPACAGKLTALL
jgi:hypothetical protein